MEPDQNINMTSGAIYKEALIPSSGFFRTRLTNLVEKGILRDIE